MEFSNSTAISTKTTGGNSITVAGAVGKVERVSITLKGLTHSVPMALEFLLVSPSGRKVLLMSGAGGTLPGVSNLLLTFDDYAQTSVPATVFGSASRPFVSGTYQPTNDSNSTSLPAPAPAIPYQSCLAQFNGDLPNGTWTLYIADSSLPGGSISGGWSLSFDARPTPPATGAVVISEFRTRGVGTNPPASDGSADEYIELYNTTDSSITLIDALPAADPTKGGGVGWRLTCFKVGGGTESVLISQVGNPRGPWAIPSHGRFLIAVEPTNSVPTGNTYSLRSYPTATGMAASGVPNFSVNPSRAEGLLDDDGGIALFSTATQSNNAPQRMDSVGFSGADSLYKEGAGLGPVTGITTPSQHAWVRKHMLGAVQDTGDNAADFQLVDIQGAVLNGVAATLGAPGPERGPLLPDIATTSAPISSPIGGALIFQKIDPDRADNADGNADFDPAPVPQGRLGTLKLRAVIVNAGVQYLLALRFRIVTLSTLTGGTAPASQADLRVLNSPSRNVSTHSTMVVTKALTLQQISPMAGSQQALGGGLNSSLSVDSITPGSSMPSLSSPDDWNASANVEFSFGVEQYGDFEIGILAEGLNAEAHGVQGLYRITGHVGATPADLKIAVAGNRSDRAFTYLKTPVTIDVLANDSVFPGLILTIATQGTYGTATIVNGKIKYTPKVNLPAGGDSFTYRYNGIDTTVSILNTSSIAGLYDGLVADSPDAPSDNGHDHSGRLQLNVGSTGAYTGVLSLGGLVRSSIAGNLLAGGNFVPATHTLLREPEDPIILTLAAGTKAADNGTPGTTIPVITGKLTSTDYVGDDFTAFFTLARRTAFPALAKPYTLWINSLGAERWPLGSGYTTAKITAAGDVTMSGRLADGSPIALTTIMLPDKTFPMYLTPYAKTAPRGSVSGIFSFPDNPADLGYDASGDLGWYKWPRPGEAHFPNGINSLAFTQLQAYQPPPTKPATRLLAFDAVTSNGKITLSDGGIDPNHPINQVFTLAANNVASMVAPNPAKVTLTFVPATGLFSGSFVHPVSKKVTPFAGAVFQRYATGNGYFLGPRPLQAGAVLIEKNTPAAGE